MHLQLNASAAGVMPPPTEELTDHFYTWKEGYQCHYVRMQSKDVRISGRSHMYPEHLAATYGNFKRHLVL